MEEFVNLHRFDEKIKEHLAQPVRTGKVLLYGSSFFAVWGYEKSRTQLLEATGGKLETVNHGFGGATVDELLYHYPRLVAPYAPKAMVIRAGYNELNRGQSPENAVYILERLLRWAIADFPEIRIMVFPVFDTRRASQELQEKINVYNALLRERIAPMEQVSLLDLNPFFYDDPADIGTRQNFRDVFVSDGLHLQEKTYPEMAEFLGQRILRQLEKKDK